MSEWEPIKGWHLAIIILAFLLLMCIGCAPVQQEAIERDYNAKIGALRAEIDDLKRDIAEQTWIDGEVNSDQNNRLLDLEDWKNGR